MNDGPLIERIYTTKRGTLMGELSCGCKIRLKPVHSVLFHSYGSRRHTYHSCPRPVSNRSERA